MLLCWGQLLSATRACTEVFKLTSASAPARSPRSRVWRSSVAVEEWSLPCGDSEKLELELEPGTLDSEGGGRSPRWLYSTKPYNRRGVHEPLSQAVLFDFVSPRNFLFVAKTLRCASLPLTSEPNTASTDHPPQASSSSGSQSNGSSCLM